MARYDWEWAPRGRPWPGRRGLERRARERRYDWGGRPGRERVFGLEREAGYGDEYDAYGEEFDEFGPEEEPYGEDFEAYESGYEDYGTDYFTGGRGPVRRPIYRGYQAEPYQYGGRGVPGRYARYGRRRRRWEPELYQRPWREPWRRRGARSYLDRYAQRELRFGHTPADRWPEEFTARPGLGRERRVSDAEIRDAVYESLFQDTWVDPERVEVEVEQGVVTLRGEVGDFMEARYVWDDAWETPGVRGVINNLTVRADVPREETHFPQTSHRYRGGELPVR